jgi:hypothetical protein
MAELQKPTGYVCIQCHFSSLPREKPSLAIELLDPVYPNTIETSAVPLIAIP